jgi:hypothetical protein
MLRRLALLDLGKLNLRAGEPEWPIEGDGDLGGVLVGESVDDLLGLEPASMLDSRGGVIETLGRGTVEVAYRTILKISWH